MGFCAGGSKKSSHTQIIKSLFKDTFNPSCSLGDPVVVVFFQQGTDIIIVIVPTGESLASIPGGAVPADDCAVQDNTFLLPSSGCACFDSHSCKAVAVGS